MLSDRERRALRELEDHLTIQDPSFPRSFDVRAQRLGGAPVGRAARAAVATVVVTLCAFMLVVGAPGGAVALAVVAGLVWLAWRSWHGPASADHTRYDPSSST